MKTLQLDEIGSTVTSGTIPEQIRPGENTFAEIWDLHPERYNRAVIHGRTVNLPRWVRAYERDYAYSNQLARAEPAPAVLRPFLLWGREQLDERLNGLLVNWHDGSLGHRHGPHRDEIRGLIPGAPIVTVSLGEERIFRLRPYRVGNPRIDLSLEHGDFVVLSWTANRHWTHEIPRFRRHCGRRISVTLRAFAP